MAFLYHIILHSVIQRSVSVFSLVPGPEVLCQTDESHPIDPEVLEIPRGLNIAAEYLRDIHMTAVHRISDI